MEEIKENSVCVREREYEGKPYPSTASGLKVIADVYFSPPWKAIEISNLC